MFPELLAQRAEWVPDRSWGPRVTLVRDASPVFIGDAGLLCARACETDATLHGRSAGGGAAEVSNALVCAAVMLASKGLGCPRAP